MYSKIPYQDFNPSDQIVDILNKYGYIVEYQVSRLIVDLPPSVSRDDLISEGKVGLIEAYNRFDESKDVKFDTYATIRVRGSLMDYLRKLDWSPRSLRRKARELEAITQKLSKQFNRQPTDEEIARSMGITLEEYRRILSNLSVLTIHSFQDIEAQQDRPLELPADSPTPETLAMRDSMKSTMVTALKSLPEREAVVLDLYYNRNLSLKEIGILLDLSESRICQLHTSAITRLRGFMKYLGTID